jgi:hypothetical protein
LVVVEYVHDVMEQDEAVVMGYVDDVMVVVVEYDDDDHDGDDEEVEVRENDVDDDVMVD